MQERIKEPILVNTEPVVETGHACGCKWHKLHLDYDIEREGNKVVVHIHIAQHTNKLTHRFEFDLDDKAD